MASQSDHPPAAPHVSPDAVAIHRERHPREVHPHHLYQTAGLLFLLALAFKFFDTLVQTFLLAYAAAILAVGLNALQRKIPLERKWFAAATGLFAVAAVIAVLWLGVPLLMEQARSLAGMGPGMEEQATRWEKWIRENLGIPVNLPGPGSGMKLPAGGGNVLGSAFGLLEAVLFVLVIFFGALFALAKPNDRLLNPLMRAVPPNLRTAFYRIFQLLGERLLGWLRGTAMAMVGVGVLSMVVWSIIGVPNAILLGLFNGLDRKSVV